MYVAPARFGYHARASISVWIGLWKVSARLGQRKVIGTRGRQTFVPMVPLDKESSCRRRPFVLTPYGDSI